MQTIIGQILGIFAPIITACSYQANTKRNLFMLQSLSTVIICIHFILLGGKVGVAINFACLLRNIFFYFIKPYTKASYIGLGVFLVALGFFGAISWEGYISLLVIFAVVLNSIFLSFGKPQLFRMITVLSASMILVYDIYVFTIGGIINETLSIVSAVVGIIIYSKTMRLKKIKTQIERTESEQPEAVENV